MSKLDDVRAAVGDLSRREWLAGAAAGILGLACGDRARQATRGATSEEQAPPMLTRAIPKSGEAVPIIGLGTWQTFDVGASEGERAPLGEVLRIFFAAGGRLIDSSPMYGRAEGVVGDLVDGRDAFLATKVWTGGRAAGEAQMERSLALLRAPQLDLMQIHNLLDWRAHLPTLRRWKEQGKIRYLGITHYQLDAFDEMERILGEEDVDFVQLPYSVAVRDAEERLLPAAAETRTAVLVMRPFESGELLRAVRGRALPGWAGELGCTSWAQLFLKFILAHPAVTCPIPATSKPAHMADNARAGSGPLPDERQRRELTEIVDAL